MISLHNLNRLYNELRPSLEQANRQVLKSSQVMMGDYTNDLEQRIATVADASYAAVVGSGSDALLYALVAEDIRGRVAMPAQTYLATANSILRAGCNPIGVDVDDQGLLDWEIIPGDIDCTVWVGLFGNSTEFPKKQTVIEDGAQHFGAPLQGISAAYSFDPTKGLPNFGNGGAVVSNSMTVIQNIKHLRRHHLINGHTGGNSLMSERECAEMCVKLDHFPFWQERRQEIARDYHESIGHLVDCITDHAGQVSKFIIRTERRADLERHLRIKGVETKRAYAEPIVEVPQARKNCNEFLQIPCDPYMTDEELLVVILAVKEFFQESPLESSL